METFRFDFAVHESELPREPAKADDIVQRDHIFNDGIVRNPGKEHHFHSDSPVFEAILSGSVGVASRTIGKTPCDWMQIAYLMRDDLERWCRRDAGGDCIPAVANLKNLLDYTSAQHSDLIPGVYEGGLKVWECTFDLMQVMCETSLELVGKRVLDLGCGAGLLGILALLKGALQVNFQDYNCEVIEMLTIANVTVNLVRNRGLEFNHSALHEVGKEVQTRCQFFSGDWSYLKPLIACSTKYDIVLTSETIYSLNSQSLLLQLLKDCVAKEGFVLVAAKVHYFGVGGSLQTFRELVVSDATFACEKWWDFADNVPRQVLKLTRVLSE